MIGGDLRKLKARFIGWVRADGCPPLRSDLLWNDPGAGFAVEGALNIGRVGDEGFFATIFQEFNNCLNFGEHGAGGC